MRDGLRLVILVIGIAASVFALVTWCGFRPAQLTPAIWITRFAAPIVVMVAIGLLAWSSLRADRAPDYLRKIIGRPFECEGLCFTIEVEAAGDIAEVHVFWQNRFSRPCTFTLSLRRLALVAVSRASLDVLATTVHCDGGAFGMTRIPIPVPVKQQGRKQTLEVSASVQYRGGRGTLLRFRGGREVRSERAHAATTALATTLGPYGVLLSGVVPRRRIRLRYPTEVRDTIAAWRAAQTEILWEPGDPVIDVDRVLHDDVAA